MSSNVVLQVQSNVIIKFSNDDVIVTLSVADRYCFLSVMDQSSRAVLILFPRYLKMLTLHLDTA
jgi:hypothetical protein